MATKKMLKNSKDDLPFQDCFEPLTRPYKYAEFNRLKCGFGNKVALISLICLLTNAYRKKNDTTTCEDVIKLLTKDNTISEEMVDELAEICEGFMSPGFDDYNNYGFSNASDMKIEIIKILNTELPF